VVVLLVGVAEGVIRNKCGVDGYNVKPLRLAENEKPYEASSPKGHFKYFFNFCGHADGCYQQPSCQVKIREDGKEEIATVTTTGELYKMKWDKMEPKDFDDVKKLGIGTFKDGLKVSYAIGKMQRSTTIFVPCLDDSVTDMPNHEEGKIAGYMKEGPPLHYQAVFPSKHGCAVPVSALTIGIPTHSKGHMFGFLLVLGILVYCCAGAWYKRERLGAQGIEMIPHVDSMCACVECAKGTCSGDSESGMGSMFARARGVGDDGL